MALSDVLPIPTIQYGSDCTPRNIKSQGKRDLCRSTCMEAADFTHLVSRKFGLMALFSLWGIVAILCVHIVVVVSARTQEQMVWIDALAIVAMVANNHVLGYFAIRNNPRYATGDLLASFEVETPIAASTYVALPFPTFIGAALVYFFPEEIFRHTGIGEGVVRPIAARMPYFVSMVNRALNRNGGFFSTATLTFTVGVKETVLGNPRGVIGYVFGKVWGIMGLHKNLHFLCQAWDVCRVARHFSLVRYSFILAQIGAAGKLRKGVALSHS